VLGRVTAQIDFILANRDDFDVLHHRRCNVRLSALLGRLERPVDGIAHCSVLDFCRVDMPADRGGVFLHKILELLVISCLFRSFLLTYRIAWRR